jgi:saccharopine dehydrogenase (NAD+, L-lysine-forming)
MVIFPVMMIGLKAFGKQAVKPLGKLLYHSYRLTTRPPYGVIMKAVVEGECNGKPRTEELWLTNENGYIFTALPVVAGLLQYLDGSSRKPGLWMLGQLIEPQRFIMDLKRLGGEVGLVNRSGFVTESGY